MKKKSTDHHTTFSTQEGKGRHWTLAVGQEDSASVQLEGEADLEPGTFTLTRWGFHVTGARVPFIPIASWCPFGCGDTFT